MEITQQQIDAAYQVADENQKKVLDALFGKQEPVDNRPVTERIKTFEDACNELSRRAENGDELAGDILCDYESNNCKGADITAYLKLRIIVAALNEGWEPQFVEGEQRWTPWFFLYTNKELEDMNDDYKAAICRVVGRAINNANAYGGLAYADASNASSYSSAYYGSRLAFKNEDLAIYAGQQFIDIYRDMMIQLHE